MPALWPDRYGGALDGESNPTAIVIRLAGPKQATRLWVTGGGGAPACDPEPRCLLRSGKPDDDCRRVGLASRAPPYRSGHRAGMADIRARRAGRGHRRRDPGRRRRPIPAPTGRSRAGSDAGSAVYRSPGRLRPWSSPRRAVATRRRPRRDRGGGDRHPGPRRVARRNGRNGRPGTVLGVSGPRAGPTRSLGPSAGPAPPPEEPMGWPAPGRAASPVRPGPVRCGSAPWPASSPPRRFLVRAGRVLPGLRAARRRHRRPRERRKEEEVPTQNKIRSIVDRTRFDDGIIGSEGRAS